MSSIKGKSICIFSAKGGVGKSMTALNLAGVFSKCDKKVLIVDFDLTGGAIATYLNKIPDKTIYNLVDDYANNRFQNINHYVTKYNDNIYVLASCKDPRQGAKISSAYIEIILEKATNDFDYVLVDTNHVLSEFNVTLLDKCDKTLVLMTNDLLDLKNMRNLIHIFNDAEMDNYKVILNESINPFKRYYTLYDIKSIIKANVDYVIDSSFFIKTIDNYISDGTILTLEKRLSRNNPKVYKAFMSICTDIMEEDNE